MAETTITNLPNAAALTGAERVPMDQGGTTVDATTAAIAATLPDATTSTAGKLSAADKTKLDSITADQATIVRRWVRNETGSTIAKGIPVYISVSNGVTPTIIPADASTEETAARTIGLTQAAINHQAYGWVIEVGRLEGINTSTLTEGQIIWLSETTGQMTTTRPTQPAHGVILGYCVKQGAGTSGIVDVKVDNGLELAELHDVLLTGAATDDVLALAADGLWKKRTLGGAAALNVGTIAGTVAAGDAPAAAIATLKAEANPLPQYLQPAEIIAGTNMSVDTTTTPGSVILNATGGGGSPGGTSGQGQFNNAGAFGGASNLVYDPTTGRLVLAGFQSAASVPATPTTAGFALYAAPTTGAFSWKGSNGFVRTLNAANITADRSYQLQDKSGTVAHLDDVFNGYAVGNYIMPINSTLAGGSSILVNTIYLQPFTVLRSIRLNELGARITGVVAASSFQLALYDSISGLPASVLGSTADLSGASATVLSSSVTEITLLAGRVYWFAMQANAALTFFTPSNTSTQSNFVLGVETLSMASTSATVSQWNRTFSQTYGTWPNLTGQSTPPLAGSRCPALILRVSALL